MVDLSIAMLVHQRVSILDCFFSGTDGTGGTDSLVPDILREERCRQKISRGINTHVPWSKAGLHVYIYIYYTYI
jgi:hypothetical protein